MAERAGREKGAHVWLQPDGTPISCREKLKVLEENWQEAEAMLREMFEDAVLMGLDPVEFRRMLADLVAGLRGPDGR